MPGARSADRRRHRDHCRQSGEDRHQRVEHAELRGEELDRALRAESAGGQPAELLGECHPVVVGVPHGHRHENECGNGRAGPQPAAQEPAAQRGHDNQAEKDGRAEEQPGELGGDAEAGREADEQPPGAIAGARHQRQGKHGERPEHDRRGVGRGEQSADGDEEGCVGPQDAAERGTTIEEDEAGQVDGDRRRDRGEDGDDANAEGVVAEEGGAEGDPPGPHRRVVVIAPARETCPLKVVGLVGTERDDGRGQQARRNQGKHDRRHGRAVIADGGCRQRRAGLWLRHLPIFAPGGALIGEPSGENNAAEESRRRGAEAIRQRCRRDAVQAIAQGP